MPLPRRVYGPDGRLTVDAIRALARRVWWSEPSEAMPVEVDRSDPYGYQKSIQLTGWFNPNRWPLWWDRSRWYDLGDGVEAFCDGTLLEAYLTVRRRATRRRRRATSGNHE